MLWYIDHLHTFSKNISCSPQTHLSTPIDHFHSIQSLAPPSLSGQRALQQLSWFDYGYPKTIQKRHFFGTTSQSDAIRSHLFSASVIPVPLCSIHLAYIWLSWSIIGPKKKPAKHVITNFLTIFVAFSQIRLQRGTLYLYCTCTDTAALIVIWTFSFRFFSTFARARPFHDPNNTLPIYIGSLAPRLPWK